MIAGFGLRVLGIAMQYNLLPAKFLVVTAVVGLVEIAAGSALLAGIQRAKWLAFVRIALGLFASASLSGGLQKATLSIPGSIDLLYNVVMIVLLMEKDPPPRRITVGAALLALSLAVPAAIMLSGNSWILVPPRQEPSGTPVTVVEGKAFKYRMAAPANEKWFLQKNARRASPHADLWIARGEIDANVIVLGETLPPESDIGLPHYMDALLEDLTATFKKVEVLKNGRLPIEAKTPGWYLKTVFDIGGRPMQMHYGLFLAKSSTYRVVASAPAAADIEPELLAFIMSFEITDP